MLVAARPDEQPTGPEPETFLEREQLAVDKARPVPRATLSARTNLALWGLRVLVGVLSAMVIYTFVSQVAH
jgi:hypothetical protein